MPLTAAEVRNAKTDPDRDYKLADGAGLYLFVSRKGGRSWRMNYRFGGKQRTATFGLYPEVSLADARDRCQAARRTLRENKDPLLEAERARQAAIAAAGATFQAIALAWHEDEKARWSEAQARLVLRALERDVFPDLGKRPIGDIDPPEVLKTLRKIERRGAIETAKRVRGYMSGVFERAIGEHLIDTNPTAKVGKALKPTPKGSKQPAITDLAGLAELQRTVDRSTAGAMTKIASRLLALTAVRVGVLRTATWGEFHGIDWDHPDAPAPEATWRIPAERMKLDLEDKGDEAFDHDVPLPAAAVDNLRALRVITGRCPLMFPGGHSTRTPMSDSAISTLYKRKGYRGRHVPHGWRAAFSTLMNEWAHEHGREGDRLVIDLMLAHRPNGMSGSEFAYNRAKFSRRRRELAEVWAGMIAADLPSAFTLFGNRAPASAATPPGP